MRIIIVIWNMLMYIKWKGIYLFKFLTSSFFQNPLGNQQDVMKVKERRKKKVKDDILRNEAFLVDKDGEDDIQVEDDEINFEENLGNILKAGEPKVSLVNNRGH